MVRRNALLTGKKMNYRRLGRSKLLVSEIGVGGHHRRMNSPEGRIFSSAAQERAAIFSRALDKGVNLFDTTFKEEVISFGEALKVMGRRDEMVICSKEVGKIRAVGNSGHQTEFMQKTMGEWDAWDVIMYPYNFTTREAEEYVLPAAKERDVGTIIMKPFSVGRFFRVKPSPDFRDPNVLPQEKQSRIATAALKWLLQNDMVCTTVPAMNELHHVDDAVAASGSPLTPDELQLLEEMAANAVD